MDYIEGLAKQASQITMYDVKSYYTQAKNMVLNVSETEAKVREATNDDPWGASSTLMQQIADGTHNFAQFNEIMPCIYSRFMEKEAREWRQIYKALTLLEFLVKNGSERVVDDARAHVSTIKMLRSFHYVDEKGKDQGINVRNRASEIALLLGDVDKIRQERRKAKANKTKYSGQGNDGGMSFITAGGSRYGGFGSESLQGGGGGGYGGSSSRGYDNDEYRGSGSSRGYGGGRSAAPEYDEYEGADDFEDGPPRRSGSSRRPDPPPKSEPKKEKAPEKPKEVNLFDFDFDEPAPAPAAPAAAPAPAAAAPASLDDDFDDFQSGPSQPAAAAAPAPAAAAAKPSGGANGNLFDLLNSSSPAVPQPRTAPVQPQPTQAINLGQPAQPTLTSRASNGPSATATTSSTPSATSPKPAGAATFDDLWTSSLSSLGAPVQKPQTKSINDLEKEKTMNKLWGPTPTSLSPSQPTTAPAQSKPAKSNNEGFDDLLF